MAMFEARARSAEYRESTPAGSNARLLVREHASRHCRSEEFRVHPKFSALEVEEDKQVAFLLIEKSMLDDRQSS